MAAKSRLGRKRSTIAWWLAVLVLVLIGCRNKPSNGGPVPEPAAGAAVEPLPAEGDEGTALGEARFFLDVYELDQAEDVLTRVLRENPKSALAHAYLARLAYRRGQRTDGSCTPQAVAASEHELEMADALQPGLADATIARGYLQYFAKNYRRAKELGLAAERASSNPLRASLLLANVASASGDLDEAERRATAIAISVREGFLLDRAFDILDTVYEARLDTNRRIELQRVRARHPGHDGRGRAR